MRSIVSTDGLAERLNDPSLRIVDSRWYLDPSRQGSEAYAAGHIPGAVFLDVGADLSAPGGGPGQLSGRHPWPSEEQVARVMSAAGIGPETQVVAYDDQAGAIAARLWYVLRAHGHDNVAVLDGGLPKWVAEGRPVSTVVPHPPPASFEGRLLPGWVVTKDDMRRRRVDALVLDARAGERFRGEMEPIDPRAGHIPGARSAPYAENLGGGPPPTFRPPQELRARYESLGAGAREPIVYCGSGVTACHDLLALDLAGLRGRLYAGSWSEWSSDPALPVETGPNY